MKTSLWPLQQMLVQKLENDAELNNVITGVYDEVSAEAVKPYVTIGEQTATPFNTKTSIGENTLCTLHCWSEYPGKKEAYEVLNLMLQALSKSPLTVDGFTLFRAELENMNVITDIDGETKHGILQLRFHINN